MIGIRPARHPCCGLRGLAIGLAGWIAATPALAEGWQFRGHLKYQYTYREYQPGDLAAVFGDDPARDHNLDLRANAEYRGGGWEAIVHYEILGVDGDTLEQRRRLAAVGAALPSITQLPNDRRRLFDLTDDVTDRDRRAIVHRLDRFSIGRLTARSSLRFGRQAVSWGNGLVFSTLDFVNPFSPTAIDKSYKTGEDMLYGQWLLPRGGDVQAIVVPRRDLASGDIESRESTAAFKWRRRFGGTDFDLLAAEHFDERLLGLGAVRSLGGAVGRVDLTHVELKDGNGEWSLVGNLDYSWIWGGKNVYGYLEYYRNGVGEADRSRYVALNAALSQRLARGEVFVLARDYAAAGVQAELTPLWNLHVNWIRNLNDTSEFLQLRVIYDWRQNSQLLIGVNLPSGDRGEEFGGIPTALSGVYATSARAWYARLAYYY